MTMDGPDRIGRARAVIQLEVDGMTRIAEQLDDAFVQAIDVILQRTGKLIVIGIGKSGIVGRKLAATLTSTGSPSIFMHPAEGLHGDLGIVQRGDVAIMISNSGTNAEIIDILEPLKRLAVPVIALTANLESELARSATVTLNTSVPREACPMGLAPTTSTTATLALGDALAVVLLEELGFSEEDYAYLHPGGALGRKLMRVSEVMHAGDALPCVADDTPMSNVLVEMSLKRLGITAVVDAAGKLTGVISDGDLRRALETKPEILSSRAADLMTAHPKTIRGEALAVAALEQMERHKITVLFVVDTDGKPVGALHLHDLLRRKLP